MTALTLDLPDEKLRRLKVLAEARGTNIAQLFEEMSWSQLPPDSIIRCQSEATDARFSGCTADNQPFPIASVGAIPAMSHQRLLAYRLAPSGEVR